MTLDTKCGTKWISENASIWLIDDKFEEIEILVKKCHLVSYKLKQKLIMEKGG